MEFALTCDPLATIGHCTVTNLLIFIMQDEVFQNISSWDELYHLMMLADKPVIILIKNADEIQQLPVLQNYTPGTLKISPTKALSYNALYFQIQCIGRCAGFQGTRFILLPICILKFGLNCRPPPPHMLPKEGSKQTR